MKKFVLVVALVAILGAGTAFASPVHPDGFGIGALWTGHMDFGGGGLWNGAALSLHIPGVPVFWGIQLGFGNALSIGVIGDGYFLGSELVNTLSWFLGVGGYVNLHLGDEAAIGLGVRVPIGLTWQPIDLIEVFFNSGLSLGLSIWTYGDGGVHFPDFGMPIELGIRFWF